MRVGVFQADAAPASPAARLAALAAALRGQRLDLVVCPELFMTGYRIAGDHRVLAEPSDGAFAQAVTGLARDSGTAILYGYPEAADGVCYNSAQLIGRDGARLANHRKRVHAPDCFEAQTFTCGDRPTILDFNGLRLAIAICYEVEFPETARQAAMSGAHLLAGPTALTARWARIAEKMIPTRALESGVWLAYSNYCGTAADAAGTSETFAGGSRIAGPDGLDYAVAGPGPGLASATVDPALVATWRKRLPYLCDAARLAPSDPNL